MEKIQVLALGDIAFFKGGMISYAIALRVGLYYNHVAVWWNRFIRHSLFMGD